MRAIGSLLSSIRRARPDEAGTGAVRWCANSPSTKSLSHEVEATEADIDAALFGSHPAAVLRDRGVARRAGRLRGRLHQFDLQLWGWGIYLEDLFVPRSTGHGYGKALLAELAEALRREWLVAVAMVGAGLEHAVDSTPRSVQPMDEWTVCRELSGDLRALAQGTR